jgi:LPXTG-site transpeptidase (sortase) family protein
VRLRDLKPPRAGPVGLEIPRLRVAAGVVPVGTTVSGELDVPQRADVVAWYRHGALPGGPGSAVLAGHVDYHGRRGVFFDLVELRRGDELVVAVDGAKRRFRVVSRERVAKERLSKAHIFDPDGPPTLVLVTCGGKFNPATRSYRENVIVRAVPG